MDYTHPPHGHHIPWTSAWSTLEVHTEINMVLCCCTSHEHQDALEAQAKDINMGLEYLTDHVHLYTFLRAKKENQQKTLAAAGLGTLHMALTTA